MARIKYHPTGNYTIYVSARDTTQWCRRWPCSGLKGESCWGSFNTNHQLISSSGPGEPEAIRACVEYYQAKLTRKVLLSKIGGRWEVELLEWSPKVRGFVNISSYPFGEGELYKIARLFGWKFKSKDPAKLTAYLEEKNKTYTFSSDLTLFKDWINNGN
jgi:hypothetical protein